MLNKINIPVPMLMHPCIQTFYTLTDITTIVLNI